MAKKREGSFIDLWLSGSKKKTVPSICLETADGIGLDATVTREQQTSPEDNTAAVTANDVIVTLTPSIMVESSTSLMSQSQTSETSKNDGLAQAPRKYTLQIENCQIEQLQSGITQGPYQPTDGSLFPVQRESTKTRTFQPSWYKAYPWLHYCPERRAMLCYFCTKANSLSLLSLSTKTDDAFITKGFAYWKNALIKFSGHESSGCHRHAVMQLQQAKAAPVNAQLSTQTLEASSREALMKVFSSVRLLARQGLALRGHEENQGNLRQLLKVRSEDVNVLKLWLERTTNFLSPESQNEMLQIICHNVQRQIVKAINGNGVSRQYGLVVDGTQDCSGLEQESICIRHVDESLEVCEVFLGLYNPPDTTGQTLATVIKDMLLRLMLPIENLRAQTYDGAANMSGKFNGCQAIIASDYPLAIYFHCTAHCANLAAESTANSCPLVRDALDNVNELGKLYKRSGKFKHIFDDAANIYESAATLKPICPTRWLCRVRSVTAVLNQYEAVLSSLEEMSSGVHSETATKARGLLDRFQQGLTILGLKISITVFGPLELLNRTLQSATANMSGAMAAVETVKDELKTQRTDERFQELLNDTDVMVQKHDIDPVTLPRQRRPPNRLTGNAVSHRADSVQGHFRPAFFTCIDTACNELNTRMSTGTTSMSVYLSLERMLLTGDVDNDVCGRYPELSDNSLSIQLQMFRNTYHVDCLSDAVTIFKKMIPEVRGMFPAVEQLLRLMLVCPVSSCTAERSFSALRRLKTWLRSTMSEQRLNAVIVSHINQDVLDSLDIQELAAEFSTRSDIRKGIFGTFK